MGDDYWQDADGEYYLVRLLLLTPSCATTCACCCEQFRLLHVSQEV